MSVLLFRRTQWWGIQETVDQQSLFKQVSASADFQMFYHTIIVWRTVPVQLRSKTIKQFYPLPPQIRWDPQCVIHLTTMFRWDFWQWGCCSHWHLFQISQFSGLGLLKGRASVDGGTSILGGESSEDVGQAGSAGGSTTSLSAAAFVCKGLST